MPDNQKTHIPFIISILIGLILTIIPFPNPIMIFEPNWILLILIFWAISMPNQYGLIYAWLVGLILDVSNGAILGQNALAFSISIYFIIRFHLILRQFPSIQLMFTIGLFISIYQFILFWSNGVVGIVSEIIIYLGPIIGSIIFWPLISLFINKLHRRKGW